MTTFPRILLVEDDADDAFLTQRIIRQSCPDCQVTLKVDGDEALVHLHGGEDLTAERADLVLLDVRLPVIDGIKVLQTIRQQEATAHLPVVMLSSSDYHRDVEAARRAGATYYLRKPLTREEFSRVLKEIAIPSPPASNRS